MRGDAKSALLAVAVGWALVAWTAWAGDDSPLVDVTTEISDVVLDLRYATDDNFLGRKVYPDGARCLLRREAVEKLKVAAETLREDGYRLRMFDCFRPLAVQWEMWKILPRPGYVADPSKGSNHNRGSAVDLGLSDKDGKELEMPTPFDTFSKAAHHGFEGGTLAAQRNRETLKRVMEAAGFKKNPVEWWHYDLPDARSHPILDEPLVPSR
jgi:zinc D-Ala-D-Ala dipeptidase